MSKKQLGTITILIKDRQTNVAGVNKLLTDNGHLIISRMGVNVAKSCVAHCTGMITLALEATASDINRLTKKLNNLYGITAKASIMTK